MKIRIKDNLVRYRLTQSEVTRLADKGSVASSTAFVGNSFGYSIELATGTEFSAVFLENCIVVKIPKAMVEELLNTDRVGFSGQSGEVTLLVEKDFVCIDKTDEDQSDNYANPNLTCR